MSDGPSIPENYNLANLWEAVVDRVGERECLVSGHVRLTYRDLDGRANRLAHHLAGQGVGARIAPLLEKLAGPIVRDVLFLKPHSLIRRRKTTVVDALEGEVVALAGA